MAKHNVNIGVLINNNTYIENVGCVTNYP